MFISKLNLIGNKLKRIMAAGAYKQHQALWGLFSDSPSRKRDFVYRHLDNEPGLSFLTVSARVPSDVLGTWSIETKQYTPILTSGDILAFSLRTNPVRTGRNAEGKQARFDVVMDKKVILRESGIGTHGSPPLAAIAQEAGSDWLKRRQNRLGIDIDFDSLRVGSYHILQIPRDQGKTRIRIATLDFDGFCRVLEPDKLKMAVFQGVGPGKAFGCGLLLIKRV